MAENNTYTPDRLDTIESRLRRLEERIERREMREAAVEPWQYLVRRQHPWRKQLYVKGRNMTARQLVGSMKANQLDEEAAAADHRVPVEAVREALAYVESNRGAVGDRGGDRTADGQAGRGCPWPSTCILTTARIPNNKWLE